MKKVLALLMALAMLFTLCACGSSESDTSSAPAEPAPAAEASDEVIHLRLASGGAVDFFPNVEIQTAIDEVAERTNGKVIIDFYPNNQLGDQTDLFQELMLGSLDIGSIATSTSYDPRLGITSLPYLIVDYSGFGTLCAPGGLIFDYYADVLNDLDIKLLGIMTEGLHGIGMNTLADPSTVKDPTIKKDELVRYPAVDVMRDTVETLGFNPVQINISEVYSAMQSGVVDGWYGGPAMVNYTSFRDVINYFVDGHYSAEMLPIMMSKQVYDSLPSEYQQIICEAFEGAGARAVEKCEQVEAEARQLMRDYGIEVIEFTPEERAEVADYVRNAVYPSYVDIYGEEIVNAILEAAK